jgi:upstream activation factor subunit UAF30
MAAPKKNAAKGDSGSKGKVRKGDAKTQRGTQGGLAKPVTPDQTLAKVIGAEPLTRAALTQKIWDYVRSNNLQDEKDRRMINADDKLKPVFGGKSQVSMFEMTKLVNQHVS